VSAPRKLRFGQAAWIVGAFGLLYTVMLTWPGVVPFNRAQPFILGIPFALAWVTLWVVLGGLLLLWIDRRLDHGEE
jgi:hypothetical protein